MKTKNESAKKKGNGSTRPASGNEDCPREQMIAEAAYYRAERRGFVPGNEMSDWLQAEADIEGLHASQ